MKKSDEFYMGVKGGLPIALGYLSVSFAFGVSSIQSGAPLWSPVLMSVTNFTGTGQFTGMSLITAGASLAEIAITIFIINIRYILMSISLSQKLDSKVSLWQRSIIAFGNTDEIFAVAIRQKEKLSFIYMIGLIFTSYFGWVFGTTLGVFANNFFPESVRIALGIALYAMFIAIILPPAKKVKPIRVVVIISVIISCILHFTPGLNKLSKGWIIIISGLIASLIGALRFPATNVPVKISEEDLENNEDGFVSIEKEGECNE